MRQIMIHLKNYNLQGAVLIVMLFSVAICQPQPLSAQTTVKTNIEDRHLEHAEAVSGFRSQLYDNPAWQQSRYKSSLNRISAYYDNSHSTEPYFVEDGNGKVFWGGKADAYLRKGETALWGFAGYKKGVVRNIKYNETEDWQLVYPYVMADTVGGGNSKQEHYDFSGGFATSLGKRWTVGGEGRYTALLDYRTRDPRPKNLTSDLKLRIGATYRPWEKYAIGAAFSFRRYKQTNEVKFYNEVGIPVTFHLTGLASDYYRFRGENTDSYYKSTGIGGSLQLAPQNSSDGFFAALTYNYMSMDKIISSLNELPLTKLKFSQQIATIGYLRSWRGNLVGLKFAESYERRKGIENIFGSAASNVYPQISSAPQYRGENTMLSWGAMYQYRAAKALYSVETGMMWTMLREKHNDPFRRLKNNARSNYLKSKGTWHFSRWLLQGDVNIAYSHAGDVTFEESGLNTEDIVPPFEHRVAALSHDSWNGGAGVEGEYAFNKFSVFAKVDWQYAHYLSHEHTNYKTITIGIEF